MLKKTFEFNGAKITVRRGKVRDRLMVNATIGKLGLDTEDLGDYTAKRFFARLIAQAQVVEGDLGFVFPTLADSEEALAASFEDFMELDGGLYDELEQALYEVDRPLNDPDLLPEDQVPEKKD